MSGLPGTTRLGSFIRLPLVILWNGLPKPVYASPSFRQSFGENRNVPETSSCLKGATARRKRRSLGVVCLLHSPGQFVGRMKPVSRLVVSAECLVETDCHCRRNAGAAMHDIRKRNGISYGCLPQVDTLKSSARSKMESTGVRASNRICPGCADNGTPQRS